jgi:uracil-DNA glycosylase family 4
VTAQPLLELPPPPATIGPVEDLVAALAAATVGETCNFYRAVAGEPPGVAALRRERLRRYLTWRWDAPVVLVGEAAGHQGARRSGVAFTSEYQLLGRGQKEPSATIVHRVLQTLGVERQVLLWNAVPFHPHAPGRPRSNRRPTAAEVAACRPFLEAVCAGRHVIAVGRVAAAAVDQAMADRADVPYVRHPAHGGAAEFTAGLARLLSGARPEDGPVVVWDAPRGAEAAAILQGLLLHADASRRWKVTGPRKER